jgi:Tfp pilus assembly protein PilX
VDQAPRSSQGPLDRREAGFVVSWLIRLVVVLAIAAVALFEVAGVMIARVSAAETARVAAQEAGFAYKKAGNLQLAQTAARAEADKGKAMLDSVVVNPQAATVTVTLHKQATTLLIHRIKPLSGYATATATETTPLPG